MAEDGDLPIEYLQQQAELIRGLTPEAFILRAKTAFAQMLLEGKTKAKQAFHEWALCIAAATDAQVFALAKDNYFAQEANREGNFLEEFIESMLEQRAEYSEQLELKPVAELRPGGNIKLWTERIRSDYNRESEFRDTAYRA